MQISMPALDWYELISTVIHYWNLLKQSILTTYNYVFETKSIHLFLFLEFDWHDLENKSFNHNNSSLLNFMVRMIDWHDLENKSFNHNNSSLLNFMVRMIFNYLAFLVLFRTFFSWPWYFQNLPFKTDFHTLKIHVLKSHMMSYWGKSNKVIAKWWLRRSVLIERRVTR
jgi:hypothetical protein